MVERLELRIKMNNIQEINKKIENLKNEIAKLNREKEMMKIHESLVAYIHPGDFLKIEEDNVLAVMKVYSANLATQNTCSINGFSLSINDHSLLIDKNAIYMRQINCEELRKIKKITKDEFVKIANEMMNKSISDLDEFVCYRK